MTEDEKEFIKKVNIDKARNKIAVPIILMTLSLATYIIPLFVYGDFDFGIIFEAISFICLLIARNYISKYDEIRAKRYIICSMLSIGWILIYDLIIFLSYVKDIVDLMYVCEDYFFEEIFSILYLIILFEINHDLSKADNPIKYKESTDWFYEKDEKKDV